MASGRTWWSGVGQAGWLVGEWIIRPGGVAGRRRQIGKGGVMGSSFLKGALTGCVCVVLGGATVALAGSGVGGVFNLGVSNSVDAKTRLAGASPTAQLQVNNTNAVAGASGLVVSSASSTPTGSFTNTAGGAAGAFAVNPGVTPLTVNS